MPVATISQHRFAGGLRGPSFPSVTIDSSGTVYISCQSDRGPLPVEEALHDGAGLAG